MGRWSTLQKVGFSLLVFFVYLGLAEYSSWAKPLKAIRGELDLGAASRAEGVVELSGEWEFFWNPVRTPRLLSGGPGSTPDAYLSLPADWTKASVGMSELPWRGTAAFRLTVRHGWKGREVGIKLKRINTAYELYADSRLVASAGAFPDAPGGPRAVIKPQSVYFTPESDATVLTLLVSNQAADCRGGPVGSIVMGSGDAVEFESNSLFFADVLAVGGRMMLVLLFLGAYAFLRKGWPLFFALNQLVVMVRLSAIREHLFFRLFPDMNIDLFVRLHVVSSFLGAAFLLFMIESFLRWTVPAPAEAGGNAALRRALERGLVGAVVSAVVLTFAAPAFMVGHPGLILLILLCCLLYPLMLIVEFVRKHRTHYGLLFFYALNVYAGVAQVLNQLRVSPKEYLRPLFFLHRLPVLSGAAEFRVEQQFVFYLFNLGFSLYLVFGFVARHLTGPHPQPTLEPERPAAFDEIVKARKVTEREAEILALAVRGLSYEQIADRCCISKGTVKLHLSSIYRKVGVKNKTELASLFIRKK